MRAAGQALAALLVVVVGSASAQDGPLKPRVVVPYDGVEVFARFADQLGLKPGSVDALGKSLPADRTILVVFGDPAPLDALERRPGGVARLLASGASLLLATDRDFSFDRLPSLGWKGTAIDSETRVSLFVRFEESGRCPLIRLADLRERGHPMFASVNQPLATNCPAGLTVAAPLRTTANLPPGSIPERFAERWKADPLQLARAQPAVAATAPDAPVRAAVVAGHGMFMNCLLVRDEVDNRAFAVDLLRWLAGEGDAKRTHLILFQENEAKTDFRLPLTGPPGLPIPPAEAINRVIHAVQQEAILQRLLDGFVTPERFRQWAIVMATAAATAYGLRKLIQAWPSHERTPAMLGAPPSRAGRGSKLITQQKREAVRRDQLGEPAQAMAREWLRRVAKVNPLADRAAVYEVRTSFFSRRKLEKLAESVWRLAREAPPPGFTARKAAELVRTLDELSAALLRGEIVFRTGAAERRVSG